MHTDIDKEIYCVKSEIDAISRMNDHLGSAEMFSLHLIERKYDLEQSLSFLEQRKTHIFKDLALRHAQSN